MTIKSSISALPSTSIFTASTSPLKVVAVITPAGPSFTVEPTFNCLVKVETPDTFNC